MSCYVVSDLTISAIVAAMADTDFEPASLKDEKCSSVPKTGLRDFFFARMKYAIGILTQT